MNIKSILVSQPEPKTDKNPFSDLADRFNLKVDFNSMTIFCTYLIFTFLISFFSYNFLEIPLKKILRKKYIKNDK